MRLLPTSVTEKTMLLPESSIFPFSKDQSEYKQPRQEQQAQEKATAYRQFSHIIHKLDTTNNKQFLTSSPK